MIIGRRDFVNSLAIGGLGTALLPINAHGIQDAALDFRTRIMGDNDQINWTAFRQEFVLDPQTAYLNTGSVGCSPRWILEQIHQASLKLEQNPFQNVWGEVVARNLEIVREKIADFWSITPAELALTENTTSGLAAVAGGIPWRAGDEVILTNHEHLSCMAVWKYFEKRFELRLKYVEIPLSQYSDDEFLSRLEDQLTDRTRLCCMSHVDSISGIELPFKRASQLLRPREILLVCDAAQSVGMLDFDFRSLGCDVLASSGHKWLMGPKGLGILFIDRDVQTRIKPFPVDWSYAALTPCTGTRNIAHLLGYAFVLEMQSVLTRSGIASRVRHLSQGLHDRLLKLDSLQPLISGGARNTTGLCTFKLPDSVNSLAIARRLSSEFQIEVKPVPPTYELATDMSDRAVDYNALRFSTHVYNSEQEYERVADAIWSVLQK